MSPSRTEAPVSAGAFVALGPIYLIGAHGVPSAEGRDPHRDSRRQPLGLWLRALAAASRGGRLSPARARRTKTELAGLWEQLTVVEITEGLVDEAGDLAEQEGLRGHDAIHLAAAPAIGVDLLTSADSDLCSTAARRGLHVANPIDPVK